MTDAPVGDPIVAIREQLTAPGGPFEVTTEVIDGHELRVFAERFGSLRVVAEFAAAHGDKEFIVFGARRITFSEFLAAANSVSNALLSAGVTSGDRVAVLAQNSPEWAMTFWGTVDIDAVLVGLNGWWNTDELIYGLEDSGAKVLVVDTKRFERIADQIDAIDTLERVYLIDATPDGDPGCDEREGPAVLRARRRAHLHVPRRAHRRGRPRGHLLHLGHHRTTEGRDQHPPQHGRQPAEHGVRPDRRLDGTGRRSRAATTDASVTPPGSQPVRAVQPRRCSTSPGATPRWSSA